MKITDRDITKQELQDIYDDFTKIEIQDGIPQVKQERHQFIAEENGIIIGFASGLTNHKWFYLSDMWVHENYRRIHADKKRLYHNLRRFRWRMGQFQMRGQVYNIDGKRFFTMGGASSHDIQDGILEPTDPDFRRKRQRLNKQGAFYRINHISW